MKKLHDKFLLLIKDNFFLKMCALMSFPVLIITFFLLFNSLSYSRNYKELLKSGYLEKLELVCKENENSLKSVAVSIQLLSENPEFMNVICAKDVENLESGAVVERLLRQIKDNHEMIDSIFLYNRDNGVVYTEDGIYNPSVWFSLRYRYAEYGKRYWDDYIEPGSDMKVFQPSIVNDEETQKLIIPLVCTKFGATETNSMIIVNINLSKMLAAANESKLTEHSVFYILNNQTRNAFCEENFFTPPKGNIFFENVRKEQTACFSYRIDGRKWLVMSYSPNTTMLSYSYIAIVPYSDINNSAAKVIYVMMSAGLLVLLVAFFGIYFGARKIYNPIEAMTSMFDERSGKKLPQERDTIKRLYSLIRETLDKNTSLSTAYSKVLPLAQERYLISLVNSNEHYAPEESEMPIDFAYDFFCSVVIKLKPTDRFYNLYNNLEYNAINAGIRRIIEAEFAEKYAIYIMPSETDTLYVLLNLPDDQSAEDIQKILESFDRVMGYDKEYMTVKIGIGGIYQGLTGLKKSHHEAVNSVSHVVGLTYVRVNDGSEQKEEKFDFSLNDENILQNHLILGHSEEAKQTVQEILKRNIQKNISDTAVIQLYIQILNVVFKVMRIKKIDYDPEGLGSFRIISEIIQKTIPEIHELVMGYIDIIDNYTVTQSTRVDIQSVIGYIEQNYNREFGLETIAEEFHVTPKYLSKLVKDKLGMNFVDYLAGLRIAEAKRMLEETDKTVSEIYELTGFNNRNTFLRTFKKMTGITPSKYRESKMDR